MTVSEITIFLESLVLMGRLQVDELRKGGYLLDEHQWLNVLVHRNPINLVSDS
jgi:hypothetical protein